jgi:LysR family hydrogen peroxide-inducible transcriptional activator
MLVQEFDLQLVWPPVAVGSAAAGFVYERTFCFCPEGQEISHRARRMLGDARDITEFAKICRGLAGELNLGIIPTIAPYLLPAALPLLRRTYPELHLKVRETQTDPLIDELIQGSLDLVIAALPIAHLDVETIPLFDDPFLLAVPHHRAKAFGVKARIDRLDRECLLLLEEGHCLREQALSACRRDQLKSAEVFGISSLSTLVQMVINDLGITLLPQLAVTIEARDKRLSLVRFASPEPKRTIGLAWRKSAPRKQDYADLGRVLAKARLAPARFKSTR